MKKSYTKEKIGQNMKGKIAHESCALPQTHRPDQICPVRAARTSNLGRYGVGLRLGLNLKASKMLYPSDCPSNEIHFLSAKGSELLLII